MFDLERWFLHSLADNVTVYVLLYVSYLLLAAFHSRDDEEVPYHSALESVERLRSGGADVTIEELRGFDHVNSWVQAMPLAAAWFESIS